MYVLSMHEENGRVYCNCIITTNCNIIYHSLHKKNYQNVAKDYVGLSICLVRESKNQGMVTSNCYIYIVIHRENVSLYLDSSGWLNT